MTPHGYAADAKLIYSFSMMAVIYRVQSAIPKNQKASQLAAKIAHGFYAAFCNNYAATGFIVRLGIELKQVCCKARKEAEN